MSRHSGFPKYEHRRCEYSNFRFSPKQMFRFTMLPFPDFDVSNFRAPNNLIFWISRFQAPKFRSSNSRISILRWSVFVIYAFKISGVRISSVRVLNVQMFELLVWATFLSAVFKLYVQITSPSPLFVRYRLKLHYLGTVASNPFFFLSYLYKLPRNKLYF